MQRLICVDHTATCNTLQQAVQLPHTNELAAAAVEAHARIQGHVLRTNLMHSHWLSSVGGCSAFLKLESEQHTNSFKVGGASRPDTAGLMHGKLMSWCLHLRQRQRMDNTCTYRTTLLPSTAAM